MNDPQLLSVTHPDVTENGAVAQAILALNNDHAQELSWLDPIRLHHLVGHSCLALRIGCVDAFLLAFDHAADYDSPNFVWFRARYRRFVYVDRVVTGPAARGRGYATTLYRHLFMTASQAGHQRVVCEINSDPPNPLSDAFHARLGFTEVGSATLAGAGKAVRYMSCALAYSPQVDHPR